MTEKKATEIKGPALAGTGALTARNTITLTFDEKDKALYKAIVEAAERDERAVSQFVLRHLRSTLAQPQQ